MEVENEFEFYSQSPVFLRDGVLFRNRAFAVRVAVMPLIGLRNIELGKSRE